MTTTITVKTHTWPVAVESASYHNVSSDKRASYGNTNSTEFVAANSERSFTVTDTTSVTVRELPEGATGLNCAVPTACSASIAGDNSADRAADNATIAYDTVEPGDKDMTYVSPFTRAQALEAAIRTTPQEQSDSALILTKAAAYEAYIAG